MQRVKLVKRDQVWIRLEDDEEIELDSIIETLESAPDGSQLVCMVLDEEDLITEDTDLELWED